MGDDLPAVDLGTDRYAVAVTCGRWHTCVLLDNGDLKVGEWHTRVLVDNANMSEAVTLFQVFARETAGIKGETAVQAGAAWFVRHRTRTHQSTSIQSNCHSQCIF